MYPNILRVVLVQLWIQKDQHFFILFSDGAWNSLFYTQNTSTLSMKKQYQIIRFIVAYII